MYGCDLVVGGHDLATVADAVRDALAELELNVIEEATVADGNARYALVSNAITVARHRASIEVPSVAFGTLRDNLYTIDVRGLRSPLWQLGLAQRLSRSLGGWAASRINDRLYDDYGHGFFLGGHPVEGGVRSRGGLVARFGIDPRVTDSAFYKSLDEEENSRRFEQVIERIGGAGMWRRWPPTGDVRVLLVSEQSCHALDDKSRAFGASLPWLVLHGTPRVVGVLAGLTEHEQIAITHDLGAMGVDVQAFDTDPSYDVLAGGILDEEPTRVLLFSSAPPMTASTIMNAIAHLSCPVAIAELAHDESPGVETLASIWDPVTARTQRPLLAWTFPASS